MSPYIHFTQKQKDRAAATDLESFLQSRGETLLPSGRDKRLASDHSVTIRGNHWYDHSARQGGNAISFVQRFCHLGYADAVSLLLCSGHAFVKPEKEPPKEFTPPAANGTMRHVFAYLVQHRRIHREVVSFFARMRLLYEDAVHHNCVFVGLDAQGVMRHAHLRGTASRGKPFRQTVEASDARYSFHFAGGSSSLYVFESPVDLLSYITLHPDNWQTQNYAACCGTAFTPVEQMLRTYPQIDRVYLCLDNDEAGHKAAQRMEEYLRAEGITSMRLVPVHKDWNDDLTQQEESYEPKSLDPAGGGRCGDGGHHHPVAAGGQP